MSEQDVNQFHEITKEGADIIADKVGISHGPGIYDEKSLRRENNGTRQMLMAGSVNDGVFAQYDEIPIGIGKPYPATTDGPKHTLGYGKSTITGEVTSEAKVSEQQGTYYAIGSAGGYELATVERAGYGKVELRNPRAKRLIAKLASKALQNSVTSMRR